MKHLILALFIFMSVNVFAQSTPTNVNRSPNTITQVDPYLVAPKRLGIPTADFDTLEGQRTSQNSAKIMYNPVTKKLRIYDPVTLTWSDAVPSGGSDSTIYKADGSTDELRTANFNDGLLLHNNNLDDYIILGNNSGYETGIYGNEGASSVSVMSNFTTINADTTIFVNYNPIGDAFDSLNVEFWYLQQKTNLPYILGVDTLGGDNYSLYRTPANFLPLDISQNTVVSIQSPSYLQIGSDGNAFNIKKPVPLEFATIADSFSGLDYTYGNVKCFNGILYGVNFPDLDFNDDDLVGVFTIDGDFTTGEFAFYVNATRVTSANPKEIINAFIQFEDGEAIGSYLSSLNESGFSFVNSANEVLINENGIIIIDEDDNEVIINQAGIRLKDDANELFILPSSILVPTPPPSGNYILKSVGGVVQWVAE